MYEVCSGCGKFCYRDANSWMAGEGLPRGFVDGLRSHQWRRLSKPIGGDAVTRLEQAFCSFEFGTGMEAPAAAESDDQNK